MALDSLSSQLNRYEWHRWLERPFDAFIFSIFAKGNTRESFEKIGIKAEYRFWAFQSGAWYLSHEAVIVPFAQELQSLRENGLTVFGITEQCENFYDQARRRVEELIVSKGDPLQSLAEVRELLCTGTTFIWLAHGFEELLTAQLEEAVRRLGVTDPNLFISEITFPKKQNAFAKLESALRAGEDLNKLQKQFAWMTARDGFGAGYTIGDLEKIREEIGAKSEPQVVAPVIPLEIKDLVEEARELVYYRTLRTDLFYELLFLARPIVQNTANYFGVEFSDLKHCSIFDLINEKYKPYPANINAYACGAEFIFTQEILITERKSETETISGKVAFPGKAQGKVVLVKSVADCAKVQDGDILVTTMTFPSYIMAMKKAVAFVTDEGGITCHAAIIAREMKKPCVIGTQVASKVLRDGDRIEVDAEQGIVRKI